MIGGRLCSTLILASNKIRHVWLSLENYQSKNQHATTSWQPYRLLQSLTLIITKDLASSRKCNALISSNPTPGINTWRISKKETGPLNMISRVAMRPLYIEQCLPLRGKKDFICTGRKSWRGEIELTRTGILTLNTTLNVKKKSITL